jgi:hypothetical protein
MYHIEEVSFEGEDCFLVTEVSVIEYADPASAPKIVVHLPPPTNEPLY